MPRQRPQTKTGRPRARKGVKLKPTELGPGQLRLAEPPAELQALARQVEDDGGAVLAAYREPLGGHALLFTALPVDKVEPTPFQRDVSDAHVLKLTRAMDKTRRYLDPILALNIEKAHNLREKSLEVARMVRDLAVTDASRRETDLTLELEEPVLVTLGFAYEQRGRLSGGAYAPALRKVDEFLGLKLPEAVRERERRAALVLELDEAVGQAVEKLKARGLTSPYLKAFVVARVNPLRFMKGSLPGFDELLATMTKRARGMDPARVRTEDVARSGGPPDAE